MQNEREFTDDRQQSEIEAGGRPMTTQVGPAPLAGERRAETRRDPVPANGYEGDPGSTYDRAGNTTTPNGTTGYGLDPAIEARLTEIQANFIDDPAKAVRSAESLIEEAVDRMMHDVRRQVEQIRTSTGDGHDTERMRLAMREYKSVLTRLSL